MKNSEEKIVNDAAYGFLEGIVDRADSHDHGAPLWHGWAIYEAFLAGAKFQKLQKKNREKKCSA